MDLPLDRQQLRWVLRLFSVLLVVGYLFWGPLSEMDLSTKLVISLFVILMPLYWTASEIRDRL